MLANRSAVQASSIRHAFELKSPTATARASDSMPSRRQRLAKRSARGSRRRLHAGHPFRGVHLPEEAGDSALRAARATTSSSRDVDEALQANTHWKKWRRKAGIALRGRRESKSRRCLSGAGNRGRFEAASHAPTYNCDVLTCAVQTRSAACIRGNTNPHWRVAGSENYVDSGEIPLQGLVNYWDYMTRLLT